MCRARVHRRKRRALDKGRHASSLLPLIYGAQVKLQAVSLSRYRCLASQLLRVLGACA